ncbi:LOW QUALITY PROTEIN: putative mannan endo-1,4-beta-mannosidase 5 [Zea mays]|uniref:LOW QUALITY PROTEIN: putative mannan endo-1,4-beta-mannosidase 5 n=1 Tax=Zea mays TaxID=4577 RepID=UPI0009A952D0|nr:LOW QUALITY PROTEIN: putative mannan endo-1,4-beta-mannosidase 5 [Zea mays]|eukprot:XP_008648425.2 LOW QUALITY PROTEIN: putative mannan endo-1,4-beta-mannosidase 5 [Zea mays]
METVFKWRARTGGGVSLIHLLVRCFAVSAAILLLADGRHADAVDPAAPVEIQQTGSSSEVADEQQWRMVRTRGNQFVVGDDDDHRPFYVNGFNTYWLMILAVDPSTRGKVTEVFQQAAAAGLTVCRTWAFNDGGWRALQKSPSVYDQDVFKALDFVVSEARKYRIRLILSLINNWDSYGGKAQYVKWAGDDAAADGGRLNITASVDDDFFSDQTVKVYFKNHVKNMLTRVNTYTSVMYKDDPTIFAWELMNEPRCTSDPAGNKLQEWIQEMAFHVKSIDPDHLLEVGGGAEGFYGPSSPSRLPANPNAYAGQVGTDFIRNHRVLGVDFASVHIYPDTWMPGATLEARLWFVDSWMEAHIADADGTLGMPVVFTEFGASTTKARSGCFNATTRDQFIQAVYARLLNSTRRGGAGAGALLWQMLPLGTDYMDDGYGVVLPRAAATARIISAHSRDLAIFNSRCAWSCRWGCRRRGHKSEDPDVDDDLPLVEDKQREA